ncbi:transcriptional regulator with XRE-family HTH domain [Breznakia sp. PF5-3]|uniref:helix-turn-helix domain-containing protein n=1 Tax=unclassified Breznakia TaxID=2623764 RepID=UPI0024070702|nr:MULTISPECIES: helix-turn-helix transcriptional regulator [unclassified Breznakia]MDF9825473.1 transcriptional regulator with XRE-family HTH domain [Breznakia sp. PM6-1]MDF9836358.1 transcriptional regulator with XRE-family HTH domain [Breznakia sp. PF5-3]MDF9838936.1 transcriptional regulator with XRE-family HTH domain [Breznakia sp. PFB2-8]MDF9860956.1 transcriptional regulator with XRE-family HTH domain [Breznakia sp. PH5-24]
MSVGSKIKNARLFRNMTLKELGLAIGFDDKSADIRMAQYESGTRVPKEDTLNKIAKTLDVNPLMLKDVPFSNAENIISTLFELDDEFPIELINYQASRNDDFDRPQEIGLLVRYPTVQVFLKEWKLRKQELEDGIIDNDEYQEWKLNWPNTCDDVRKHSWRK